MNCDRISLTSYWHAKERTNNAVLPLLHSLVLLYTYQVFKYYELLLLPRLNVIISVILSQCKNGFMKHSEMIFWHWCYTTGVNKLNERTQRKEILFGKRNLTKTYFTLSFSHRFDSFIILDSFFHIHITFTSTKFSGHDGKRQQLSSSHNILHLLLKLETIL